MTIYLVVSVYDGQTHRVFTTPEKAAAFIKGRNRPASYTTEEMKLDIPEDRG